MAGFALLAMLALTLLPGIGRLSQHAVDPRSGQIASADAPDRPFGAICTTRGLAYDPAVAAIEAVGFAAQADEERRSPAPAHAGMNCDYCTIASASNVPAVAALAAPALNRDIALPLRRDRVALWHYPLGLGSRGPPLTA